MKKALVLLILLCTVYANAQVTPTSHNYEFANGNWFDGQKFVARTVYSAGTRYTGAPCFSNMLKPFQFTMISTG